jgi:NAD(P)-dependent dehydrogenase (short-subunit alcohol dehydrogenase family)
LQFLYDSTAAPESSGKQNLSHDMTERTLVVLGSGPGIGVGVAGVFAAHGFTHIALVARNAQRLEQDKQSVLEAVQDSSNKCEVKTWPCDLTDYTALHATLKEIEAFGSLECVFYNAARVQGKGPLEETREAIQKDLEVSLQGACARSASLTNPELTNLALYEVAIWAFPILQKVLAGRSPSFFVTNTTLYWREPLAARVSLSMSKCAQRALVLCLNQVFGKEVHVALLSVGGVVNPNKKNLTPKNISNKCWEL